MAEAKSKIKTKKGKEDKSSSSASHAKASSAIEVKLDTEQMAQAGLHFGQRTSKTHPKMKPYIFAVRNGVHLIDLEKTAEKLREALNFIREVVSEGKTLLLVGTKIQVKDLVKKTAEECQLPYVSERWLGGTFTNFSVFKKRIEYFKDLEKKKKEGELEKYTKKEQAQINKELTDLEMKFGGIRDLNQLPAAIFVLDMKKDELAVREARAKDVKIIGVSDTNIDPTLADYPIPANDDAVSSLGFILDKVKGVVLKAKPKAKKDGEN